MKEDAPERCSERGETQRDELLSTTISSNIQQEAVLLLRGGLATEIGEESFSATRTEPSPPTTTASFWWVFLWQLAAANMQQEKLLILLHVLYQMLTIITVVIIVIIGGISSTGVWRQAEYGEEVNPAPYAES